MKYKSAFLAIAIYGLLAAQPQIAFTEYNLKNGLHVILHQDNSLPIVAVTVTYHVGSKNEDSERTGFAHFFEHLMFEGSENIKRGQIDELIKNAGGQLNASTSFDLTNYYFVLPSNQMELGLWIESERMLHAKIDSIGVETQRSVVKEERRSSYDNRPYGSVYEQVFKHAYKEHPYRWTPIGSFQYIDKAEISEFVEFYKTFYVPNNAVLSIAGDINIPSAKKLVEKYFTDIPKSTRPIPRPKISEPPQTAEVRDTVFDNIRLPGVIQAYHMPRLGSPDSYALEMLTTLLSSGQSSRLYKTLIDNRKLAIQTRSMPVTLEDPGLFIIFSIAAKGKDAKEVEDAVREEIARTQDELISEEEFTKLRNQTELRFVREKSRMLGIASALAEYHILQGRAGLINQEIQKYMAVTREDIRRVARKYLTAANSVVLYYLPKPSKQQ